MQPGKIFSLIKQTITEWQEDKASRLAAALSYYTLFSLAPLLLVTVSLLGLFLSADNIRGEILNQIEALGGENSTEMIEGLLDQPTETSGLAGIIGLVTLLIGATGVFSALQDALNTIWNVPPKNTGGFINTIKTRLLSFALIPVLGFLLLVSLLVDAGMTLARTHFSDIFPGASTTWLIQVVSWIVSLLVIALFFAAIYKILPDIDIAWSDVWVGSLVTSALFSLGRIAIGIYIGRSSTVSVYGAAGSLIVILLWVYYSAQLVFLGAEFTQVYTRMYGSHAQAAVSDQPAPKPQTAAAPRPAAASPKGYAITASIAFFLGALVRGQE